MVPLTKIPNLDFLLNHPYPLQYHLLQAAEVGLFTALLCTRSLPPHGQPQVTTRLFIVFLILLFAAFVYYASRTVHSIIFPDSNHPVNSPCLSSHAAVRHQCCKTPTSISPFEFSPVDVCKALDGLKKLFFYFELVSTGDDGLCCIQIHVRNIPLSSCK